MTIATIPITTYSIRANKPDQKFGSPAQIPLRSGGGGNQRALVKVSLAKVPTDATITSAKLQLWTQRAHTGSTNIRVRPITSKWNSSVTFTKQPTYSSIIQNLNPTDPPADTLYEFDVLSWAVARPTLGLMIDSSGSTQTFIRGSAAANLKPVLVVDYYVGPDQPGNLIPTGGSVSVASPILTYAHDEDMTSQRIQFSPTGNAANITWDSGWLPATAGRWTPTDPGNPSTPPVLTSGGSGIYWRVTTDGPSGQSIPSEWAYYEFDSMLVPTITAPPATTNDGSPTLQWTIASQTSYRATLRQGTVVIDSTGWVNDPAARDWTPGKGIPVPGATGRFTLEVRDAISPRVVAEAAPTAATVNRDFTTALSSDGGAIDSLVMTFEDPIPVFTGVRSEGIPDQVSLFRDGIQVPIFDPDDGTPYTWAPGAAFFIGNNFTIRDYTADLRHEHTWAVRTRTGGASSPIGPTVTAKPWTKSVWLVNSRTGEQVEILGYGELPAVSQETVESAILHTPVHGDLLVQPIRRRLMRTTRQGSLTGVVLNEHEQILNDWVLQDSGSIYRLIFGKVNWPVIIGDYSPADNFYPDNCGPDHLLLTLNWWQRLSNY